MTTMNAWKPSDAQVEFVTNLFKRKFTDTPEARQFWANLKQVSSNAGLTTFIDTMKAMPDVRPLSDPPGRQFLLGNGTITPPVLPELATEAGLYRDPSDGTLYRLTVSEPKHSWERPQTSLSVYSNKAVYRRLTPEGQMVKKGKWTRFKAYEKDRLITYSYAEKRGMRPVTGTKVLASWLMDDDEKLEWAVGFCLMCSKSLIDAVSVFNSIGPVCAKKWGVVLQMPPEA